MIEINGKDLLSEIGELNVDKICVALAKITGKKFTPLYNGVPGRMTGQILKLPRPMINTPDYDFSFSGLKTASRTNGETARS